MYPIPYNVSTARPSLCSFNEKVVLKIINDLNINKAHGHYDRLCRMIKLCSKSVVKPLSIFKNCIDTGTFPDIWKRSNVILVHKEEDKQIVNNYRPVSLLPIFGKTLEKLFNSIMDFLEENNWLNSNQSSFSPNNSCEIQHLLIVYEIHSSIDSYPSLEGRRYVFRYI